MGQGDLLAAAAAAVLCVQFRNYYKREQAGFVSFGGFQEGRLLDLVQVRAIGQRLCNIDSKVGEKEEASSTTQFIDLRGRNMKPWKRCPTKDTTSYDV